MVETLTRKTLRLDPSPAPPPRVTCRPPPYYNAKLRVRRSRWNAAGFNRDRLH